LSRLPYPFGEPAVQPAAFQSAIYLRSFCLRGSGAVAPSAPATPRNAGRSLPQVSYGPARMIRVAAP